MRILPAVALVAGALLLAPAASSAQILGEVAAKEKAKKKTPAKVYTEDDLRRAGGGHLSQPAATPAAADSPSPAKGASAPGAKPKSEEEQRAEAQKAWRAKLDKAQKDVTDLTKVVSDLEAAAGDVRGALYSPARGKLLSDLEEAKKQLAATKQTAADLEEEGRRNRY